MAYDAFGNPILLADQFNGSKPTIPPASPNQAPRPAPQKPNTNNHGGSSGWWPALPGKHK